MEEQEVVEEQEVKAEQELVKVQEVVEEEEVVEEQEEVAEVSLGRRMRKSRSYPAPTRTPAGRAGSCCSAPST